MIHHRTWLFVVSSIVACSLTSGSSRGQDATSNVSVFDRDNLVAWCIVPFDGKKRGPAERAEMVKRLGFKHVAYDWRAEHVETFEQEILEYKQRGLDYFAFWGTHPTAFELFRKYDLHPQIWNMFPAPEGDSQTQRVENAAKQLLPLVEQTRQLGCRLGLYNHGGWSGEPANMVAVCRFLKEKHQADHVGIVYNQHHAHEHIDDFADVMELMKPHLLCLNLNGMSRDGDKVGKKILPLGEGEFDVRLLKVIRDSGYAGPIGIIGHTSDDVEQRLQDNLDGLDWIVPQLTGKPAGPKPKLRTWSPVQPKADLVNAAVLDGKPEFRAPPITVECRVTLPHKDDYNILVASDAKQSGAHWEMFTVHSSGMFSVFTPGRKPDHVHSNVMICDGRPHTVCMLYEPERIRLMVDGKVVADQAGERIANTAVPGGLAIGRLVEGTFRCRGEIDWVRISRGIRTVSAQAVVDVEQDDQTVLLWRPEAKDAGPVPVSKTDAVGYSPETVSALLKSASDGNPARGLVQFASAKSACVSCHRIGKHGGTVGPDLSKLAKERKPEEIVEAVVWPKRHVKPEYNARLFVTEDGKSRRGYIVKRDEKQVVVRDPTRPGDPHVTIDVGRIEFEREVGTLMPDNLIAALSTTQRDDLFRFLLSLGRESAIPAAEMDALLLHASAHTHGPALFPIKPEPLRPQWHPHWQLPVNRDRIYDFYAKQADYFKQQSSVPTVLAEFPGLDGGQLGHWGNQNEDVWANDAWNNTDLGSVQCGVFRGAGVTVPRGVCVRLGDNDELTACFNPDTLTYDAVWKDGFVKLSSVRHGFVGGLTLDGTPLPLPDQQKRVGDIEYHGFYRHGKHVWFSFRVGEREYLESPWVKDGKFVRLARSPGPQLRQWMNDAPTLWPEKITTTIEHGTTSPYAVDTIGLPVDNPWKSLTYVGGLNFLPDGSALICTMQGDVWRASDIQFPSKTAAWKRFATGLHQPLGMIVDKDAVFVMCRDQLTRLHDFNRDGEADFYECVSNAHVTSPGGHDFICGLERDRDGYFYTASGNQGIVQFSPDGKQAKVLATGFRNPDGIGLLPDGTVTVPCSEGSWTPATMICAVRPSDQPSYHGFGGPQNDEPPELPLVYIPRGIDNSAGGQTVVTSDQWGPLKGQLLHFSFGTGSYHLVLRDEVDGQLQGALVPMPGEFLSGTHRGRFNPVDGQLYVGGMQGWGSYTPDTGCFQRVRYTGEQQPGQQTQLPVGWHAHENGVAIEFSAPMDAEFAGQAKHQFAQCWNYRYSKAYGSPEFSTLHPGMKGHDVLSIASAHVVGDGKVLFLEIPELQPVNQLHLRIATDANTDHELFATVHKLRPPFTEFSGYRPRKKTINRHPIYLDLALAARNIFNPHSNTIPGAREVEMKTSGNLSFDMRRFHAQPNELLALKLVNADVVPHNWALVKPGTLERVGQTANKLIADPDAVLRQYVPETSDVLAWTDIVMPREQFTIYFRAPKEPGIYPYLCTFPGHWLVMNGEMIVETQAE